MNASDLRYTVKQLIGIFRQCGNTTTLIQAALNSNAYLVVADLEAKKRIVREHPVLKDRVFSIKTLETDMRSRKSAPLLFDPAALLQLCNEEKVEQNKLTLVKVKGNPSVEDLEAWRDIFEEASHDPDFKIFTHEGIEVEQLEYDPAHLTIINSGLQPQAKLYKKENDHYEDKLWMDRIESIQRRYLQRTA